MSYCRFSSSSFRSDLYAYEDVGGGWTTHVACNRIVGDLPPEPKLSDITEETLKESSETWLAQHRVFMDAVRDAPRERIGLPHDGESFNDATLGEFRDRIAYLQSLGYHVPERTLALIDEEIADYGRDYEGYEGEES